MNALSLIGLPVGLGLLGFIEPCSVGASLLFIKSLENRRTSERAVQVVIFTIVRAVLMGMLGLLAVLIGSLFLAFQKVAWTIFGVVYFLIGLIYLAGRSHIFLFSLGPRLATIKGATGSAMLAILFAFNIPACAGPLLAILVGATATAGASGMSSGQGFLSMALFGLALSAPIAVASFSAAGARYLNQLSALSRRVPRCTGVALIILGGWSVWSGIHGYF